MHGKTDDLNLNNKRGGFTIVELMLLLVVVSLIVASSVSVITRKHKLVPSKTIHGQYFCFREPVDENGDGGRLHEVMYSGKSKIKENIEGVSEGFTECTFDPPKKASYLYLQVLGGGGAGGNADFFWKEYGTNDGSDGYPYESAYFSLLHDDGFSSAGHVDLTQKQLFQIYNTGSFYMLNGGVTPYKVSSFFDGQFPAELYEYVAAELFKVKVFAWDYAGGGQPGYGYSFNYLDWDNLFCGINNTSGPDDYFTSPMACARNLYGNNPKYTTCSFYCDGDTCYDYTGKFKDPNSDTNVSVSDEHCPEGYFYAYPASGSTSCPGTEGGKRSVFGTAPYPWVCYAHTILGQLYTGDTSKSLMRDDRIDCDAEDLIDSTGCYKFVDATTGTIYGKYEGSISLDPNTLGCQDPEYASQNGCIEVWGPSGYSGGWIEETATSAGVSGSRFPHGGSFWAENIGTKAGYGSVISYTDDPKVSKTATCYNCPEFKNIEYEPKDGAYPFFKRTSGKTYEGVSLVISYTSQVFSKTVNSGCFKGSHANGLRGLNLPASPMNTVVLEDGTFVDCPTFGLPGEDGDTYIDYSCTAEGDGLGVYPKEPNLYWMMYFLIPTKNVSDNGGAIDSYYFDMFITLVRNWIRMTYGERGGAGGYTATFARSFSNSSIKLIPGEGGKTAVVTHDKDANPAAGGSGGTSYLYFHCTSDDVSSCTGVISASGGAGGRSRLEEPAEAMSAETFNGIVTDICKNNGCRPQGSYTRDYLENLYRASTTYTTGAYKGEASQFRKSSMLLGLDALSFEGSGTVDLSLLGSGGDGGYVEDKCWATPTYFTIKNGAASGSVYLESDILTLPNYGTDVTRNKNYSATKTDYPGVVSLDTLDLQDYCQTTEYDASWQETAGTAGQPGAIVITW